MCPTFNRCNHGIKSKAKADRANPTESRQPYDGETLSASNGSAWDSLDSTCNESQQVGIPRQPVVQLPGHYQSNESTNIPAD